MPFMQNTDARPKREDGEPIIPCGLGSHCREFRRCLLAAGIRRFSTRVPARAPAITVRTESTSQALSSWLGKLRLLPSTIARMTSRRSCAPVPGGISPRSIARVTIDLHSAPRSSTAVPMIAWTSGWRRSSSSRAHARPSTVRLVTKRREKASTRSSSSRPVSGSGVSRSGFCSRSTRARTSAARLGQRR